jgi:SAM-dependent methyltransferase
MQAREYYNEKPEFIRRLNEGDGIRNTHNFIKARLIERFMPTRSHILDLGCGQGGDLLKYRRKRLKSYRGIDVSHTAIERNNERIVSINLRCRCKLECIDFCSRKWHTPNAYDVVSCQFALQYAFQSETMARNVIGQAATSLKDGGIFLGTIPVHDSASSFTQVQVKLPDDDRECLEYVADHKDIKRLCEEFSLEEILFDNFEGFYAKERATAAGLAIRMRALSPPDRHNAVFVYRKQPETITLN